MEYLFKKFHAPQADAEKDRLTQAWYNLRMGDGEPPNDHFSRGSVIRVDIARMEYSSQTKRPTSTFLARRLSLVFGVQKAILLACPDLTYQAFEDVVFSAQGEMDMAREQKSRNGTGHALVVPGSGQGNGGAQHGGAGGGRGVRGESRKRDNRGGRQQQQPQPQQQQQPRKGSVNEHVKLCSRSRNRYLSNT